MNIERIKNYIMNVLIHKKDRLAICPTLVIDRLFDGLELETVNQIANFANSSESLSPDIKDCVWDRYLIPRLALADMHVKVFAR